MIFLALVLPLPPLLAKYTVISTTIVPLGIVWTTNVRPVADYLGQHDHHGSRGGLTRLLLPWAWLWRRIAGGQYPNHTKTLGRVACAADKIKTPSSFCGFGGRANNHLHETPLAAVMEFLPLQQAFGEYCHKSLCGEVCT